MSRCYLGHTANGQTLVYYIAEGASGEHAFRDIRRHCDRGDVKAITMQEAIEIAKSKPASGLGMSDTHTK